MMAPRKFFDTRAGKAVAILFASLALGGGVVALHNSITPSYAQRIGRERVFICSETGRVFNHELNPGEPTYPVKSPFTHKMTGYPTEACYWTADGSIRDEPAYVLLNEYIGKPGITFCPDCGRIVVSHNPAPVPGARPPMTKAEYQHRLSAP